MGSSNAVKTVLVLRQAAAMLAVLIFFPLELSTGILSKTGLALATLVEGSSGLALFSPVKALLKPIVKGFLHSVNDNPWLGLLVAVAALYFAIVMLTKVLKGIFLRNVENAFQGGIFDNAAVAFAMGIALTFLVQSSSITTSTRLLSDAVASCGGLSSPPSCPHAPLMPDQGIIIDTAVPAPSAVRAPSPRGARQRKRSPRVSASPPHPHIQEQKRSLWWRTNQGTSTKLTKAPMSACAGTGD